MTATLAEVALGTRVLEDAHPEIARMLRWHAAEEIEHRAVAYDVLGRVDPRLRMRAAGVGMGLGVLGVAWVFAFAMLRSSVDEAPVRDRAASRRFWGRAGKAVPEVGRALRRYLSRDFHPDRDVRASEAAHAAKLSRLKTAYANALADLAAA